MGVDKTYVDEIGVDETGVDEMGVDKMGRHLQSLLTHNKFSTNGKLHSLMGQGPLETSVSVYIGSTL